MPAPHRLYPRSLICLAQALLAWALLAWTPAQASQELTLVGKAAVPDVEVALDGDWQLRAEYLHVGLGTVTTPLLFDGSVGYLHRSDAPTLDILRLALTRGF